MAKLNQILAIEKGEKERAQRDLTEAHHVLQKQDPLKGISRSYQPKNEDGDKLPSERTLVQIRGHEVLRKTQDILSRLFDITAAKEYTNASGTAKADIVIDGTVFLEGVPATYLVFLEKQLIDLYTFIRKLPVLDPAESWDYDKGQDCWATQPVQTARTQKIQRPLELAKATEKFQAQVQLITEDVIAGYWTQIKFSGAFRQRAIADMLSRLEKLRDAVKAAREEANAAPAVEPKPAAKILSYLFEPGMTDRG